MTTLCKILLLGILCYVWWVIRHVRKTELPEEYPYSAYYDKNGNLEYRV